MNNGLGSTGWCWLLVSFCLGEAAAPAASAATRYPLVRGSTYTAGGKAPLVPLRGGFVLAPQVGPLDWETFRVEWARFETGDGAGAAVWRGSGYYFRGGRSEPLQELILDLSNDAGTVRFDSGVVPANGAWPELDLVLTGDVAPGPQIHLKAVPELARWRYRTLAGATFLDDCAECDRLPFYVPVEGGFDLVLTATNPLFSRYHLFDIRLTDGDEEPGHVLTGEGSLEIGGEVLIQQHWTLELEVQTPSVTRSATFKNAEPGPEREFPMLHAALAEDGGDLLSRFFLELPLAPLHGIWFNTAHGLTSGLGEWPSNRVSGADILEASGRVVTPGASLLKAAGLPADQFGIDAFDVVPGRGGLIVFSPDADGVSTTLGAISEGDLLASDGRVWRRNRDLLASFGFMPPTPDLGLDAVSINAEGRHLFSVRQAAFSEKLGIVIGPGDLLSDAGEVVRSHADLLVRFKPVNPGEDHGLDALFVWPSGEVWFSTEISFESALLGYLTDGDLLSDRGYVVARSLDLVRRFQPLEDLANFGLQGVQVISDATALPDGATVSIGRPEGALLPLDWRGAGRVFQVESAPGMGEPFAPASDILPAASWSVPWTAEDRSPRIYRVRSW